MNRRHADCTCLSRALARALVTIGMIPVTLLGQTGALQLGTRRTNVPLPRASRWSRAAGRRARYLRAELYDQGRLNQRGQFARQDVVALASPVPEQNAQAAGAGANGINVGDAVEVLTGFGWTPAKVVAISGNSYRVLVNGIQVTKDYPAEVRRVGAATAHDHASGQYRLGDPVQVNVDGRWTDGRIVTEMGTDYQIELPGGRTMWATGPALRPAPPAPAVAAAPQSGVPPKAGMTSCAGKIEGRYASTGGFGSFTLTFRGGKATMTDPGANEQVLECWTAPGRSSCASRASPNWTCPSTSTTTARCRRRSGNCGRRGADRSQCWPPATRGSRQWHQAR